MRRGVPSLSLGLRWKPPLRLKEIGRQWKGISPPNGDHDPSSGGEEWDATKKRTRIMCRVGRGRVSWTRGSVGNAAIRILRVPTRTNAPRAVREAAFQGV